MSVGPPVENGTTKRTVLVCAKLPNVASNKLAAMAMWRREIMGVS
jgi:hypothetical protein